MTTATLDRYRRKLAAMTPEARQAEAASIETLMEKHSEAIERRRAMFGQLPCRADQNQRADLLKMLQAASA